MLEVLLLYVFGNHDQGVHTERMEKRLRGEPHRKQYERILIRKDGTEVVIEFTTTTTKWIR
jgi:PAS domain S-box-containing protein